MVHNLNIKYNLVVSLKVWYQGIEKATVSGVVEDLKFKISEGSDRLRQLIGQTQEDFNFGPSLLKF